MTHWPLPQSTSPRPANRAWSVRSRLLLLILVFVLPGSVIFAWLLAAEWQQAGAAAHGRVELLASNTASRLAAEFRDDEVVLRRFAERPLVRALDPARCDPLIHQYIELHPEFLAINVRDLEGNVVCAFRANAPPAAWVAATDWFQQAKRSGAFRVSDALVGPATGRGVSALTYPVQNDQGQPAGLLVLAVDLLNLQRRVLGHVPEGAIITAADRAGNVVLRSRDPEKWLGQPAPAGLLAQARRSDTSTAEDLEGVRRLYAHVPVADTGWLVVAGLPEAEVFAAQRTGLARGVGVGLAVLALVLLLAWRIVRAVVEPVHALAQAASRVARGDLAARAQLVGPTEIGEVAQEFNDMLDARDVADAQRDQADQALRERERFVSALMSNLPGMVYRCRNDPQWTMEFVSEGCKSITGYERGQLEGNREIAFGDLVHPEDHDALWSACQASLDAHKPCSNEYRVIARDGSVRWVWDRSAGVYAQDGTLLSVEGFVQDITERRRAAAALRQSEGRYRSIIETSLDAVVQMDGAGLITGWSPSAVTMLGWSASQAVGRALHETIIPPRYRDAHQRGMAHFLAGGEGVVVGRVVEIEALRNDGTEFPVELTVTALRNDDAVEFSAFLRDISSRRNADAQRLVLEAQLRESQKLEAVGTLAGGIAHDFNNIMGAILGNVALAREDVGPGHAATASLEQVQRAALRARSLVQQILAYSRRQPRVLVSQPLAPLIRETVALLRATLPAGVVLDLALDDNPLHVLCDATQMQQVLINLCTNAWHAMAGGAGRVEIGLAPVKLAQGEPRPGGLPPGDYGCLWVSDDGRGMDVATRDRIFEPFYTTKSLGEGTGLGLSVVHGIVTAHSGAVVVDSTPGRGSTFRLYLPRQPDDGEGPSTVPGALESEGGGGEHVLYIDDDEVMVQVVERLLARAGYRVTGHRDPWQAVVAVRAQSQAFDIVVTDYNMPGFSGLDVVRELKALRSDLPVVISSGLVTETLRAQAQLAGARAVMQKENTFEELVPLVQRVLRETLLRA